MYYVRTLLIKLIDVLLFNILSANVVPGLCFFMCAKCQTLGRSFPLGQLLYKPRLILTPSFSSSLPQPLYYGALTIIFTQVA